MKMLKKGFTLVELIVVITIIAILATIAFITLGDYPVDARDSKRQSNIADIYKKLTILTAKGDVEMSSFLTNTTTTYTGTNVSNPPFKAEYLWSNSKAGYWEIDIAKIGEDPASFKDGENNYGVVYAKGGYGTGTFNCLQVVARSEKTNQLFVSGNCNEIIPGISNGSTGSTVPTPGSAWPYQL